MEGTKPDLEELRIGPAERPDDPLVTSRRHASTARPATPRPPSTDHAKDRHHPAPDVQGCYFLG